jgi:hypothetical protein
MVIETNTVIETTTAIDSTTVIDSTTAIDSTTVIDSTTAIDSTTDRILHLSACDVTTDTAHFASAPALAPPGFTSRPIANSAVGGYQSGVCTRCRPGQYSAGGISNEFPNCPTGYYGNQLMPLDVNSDCKGMCNCAPGYYCPSGSTSSAEIICPVGYYCPGNAASYPNSNIAIPCTSPQVGPGWFCDAKTSLNQMGTTDVPCPAGQTCAIKCLVGNYCTGGSALPSLCQFPTGSGYYCPIGMSTSTGLLCPAGFYCANGDVKACAVAPGNYCKQGGASASGEACPQGSWCAGGTAANLTCAGHRPDHGVLGVRILLLEHPVPMAFIAQVEVKNRCRAATL